MPLCEFDVIIIGAGAAGLMCAIEAGKRNRRTLIIDHANKPGKKILMSGGGRCNFTNLNIAKNCYLSQNKHFCKSALSRYTQFDFIDLVKKYKIPYHEKTLGQLFCDNKAKDILNMLLSECNKYQVKINLSESIENLTQKNNFFYINTNKNKYKAQSLVIATGGKSIPTMGATGFGYQVAKDFKINVNNIRASLVPFTFNNQDQAKFNNLAGVSLLAEAQTGKTKFLENILFTHKGLSGPAILQISNYWQPNQSIILNFLPEYNLKELLIKSKQASDKQNIKNFLANYLPKRFIQCIIPNILLDTRMTEISNKNIEIICNTVHNYAFCPNNTEGYRTAEVTLGGVDCNAICSKTMQAKTVPNLYFIGEVLDVTGWLGGYNFQWAWSSGFAAGQYV